MSSLCDFCGLKPALVTCGHACGAAAYCSQACANSDYGTHAHECTKNDNMVISAVDASLAMEGGVLIQDFQGEYHHIGVKAAETRKQRLAKKVEWLYHQTNEVAAKNIVKTQKFRLGKDGYAGAGIYFALTPAATFGKAHEKGVIVKAKVKLGRVLHIHYESRWITPQYMKQMGYDSVYLERSTGPEYVVYFPDQVTNMSIVPYTIPLGKAAATNKLALLHELMTTYKANEAAGMMFLITGTVKGKRVIVLGLEKGGAYKGQYNMFGGRHDKDRTRVATAQAEFCEEFGASALGPSMQCNVPTVSQLKRAKKIFANLRIEPWGERMTTIVILWDLKDKVPSRTKWNQNNARARANPNIYNSYKEMLGIEIFDADSLIALAMKTPVGKPASATPIPSKNKAKPKVTVSFFTLQTLRDMRSVKYI